MIEQGANLLAIAQRMGHTDPAVTLRAYGHLFAGVQEDLTQRLDDLRHVLLTPVATWCRSIRCGAQGRLITKLGDKMKTSLDLPPGPA